MPLELNNTRQILHQGLRPLMRELGKKNIEAFLLLEGWNRQSLMINHSQAGVIFQLHQLDLRLCIRQGDKMAMINKATLPDEMPDHAWWLSQVEEALEHSQWTLPEDQEFFPEVLHADGQSVDPELLNMELEDWMIWFQSRFLADAPRRMVYDALLSRGEHYMGLLSSSGGYQFHGRSLALANISLRTKEVTLNYACMQDSLRAMNLEPIRRRLSPYWVCEREELVDDLPIGVFLDAEALAQLTLACCESMLKGNQLLWNWLEPVDTIDPLPLPLHVTGDLVPELHPPIRRWKQPAGNMEINVESLLSGEACPAKDCIYVRKLAQVNITEERIRFYSRDTLLICRLGAPCTVLSGHLELMIDGEGLASQRRQASQRLRVIPLSHHPLEQVIVPDGMYLDKIRIRHLNSLGHESEG